MSLLILPIFALAQGTEDLMDLSLDELLNMQVTTASKSAVKLSDAPGIVSVLSHDELERFGGTTLRDVLERVPGLISLTANYTNRSTIAPRGDQIKQNSSHVLFLINGRPIREVQEGGVSSDFLEAFPVNVVERIEVIKGPGSVLYGSDAFSAVVNVITLNAKENDLSVTAVAESEGGFGTSGNMTVLKGDLSIVASGRYYDKSDWDAKTYYNAGVDSVTGEDMITTQYSQIPDKSTGAYLGLNYKNLSIMTSFMEWNSLYYLPGQFGEVKNTKVFTNLGYTHKVSDTWDMDFNLTYVQSKLDGKALSERDGYNLVGEWTNSLVLNDKTNLVIGGLYNINSGEETNRWPGLEFFEIYDGTILSKGDVSSIAVYSQLDYQLKSNLKFIGGIQAIKVENIDLKLIPRGGLIWYPAEKINVKALYSEAFRAPSINEVNMNFGDILQGNPDLKPENVATIDFSVGYQGDQTNLAVNFFRSQMSDIIQLVYDTSMTQHYQNNLDVLFTGVEFEAKYFVNKNLYLVGSALYQKSENDDMENLSPIPDFGMKAGISYASEKGFSIGLFNIYQGEPDDKFVGELNPDQGSYNLMHLHSTFHLNKLLKLKMKQDLKLVLNVDNVLDKAHYAWDSGNVVGDAIPLIPGRKIYAGLNVNL